MSVLFLFIFGILEAQAVRLAMEPQNRGFIGASYNDGGQGLSVGIESRLTQLIYVNIGGFTSLSSEFGDVDSDSPKDWFKMNHGIWAAPGWRIPHRYKENAVNWDIIMKGGFACVFSSDSYREDLPLFDPAGLAGVDFYLRKNRVGLRWSNKVFFYEPESTKILKGVPVQKLQSALEIFWQWE
jgi:hypothetical protein